MEAGAFWGSELHRNSRKGMRTLPSYFIYIAAALERERVREEEEKMMMMMVTRWWVGEEEEEVAVAVVAAAGEYKWSIGMNDSTRAFSACR